MEPTSTSQVLLGVFDSSCPSPYLSAYENKIGGYPDCFASCHCSSLPTCLLCGDTLCLLLQVYCPLENTEYHRTIHIFCCVRPACHGNGKSWLVLRSQYREESCDTLSEEVSTTTSGLSATDWCVEADDWGSNSLVFTGSSSSGNIEKQIEQLSISGRPLSTTVSTQTNTVTDTDQLTHENSATESATATLTSGEATPHTTYSAPFYPPAYLCVIEEPEMSSSKQLQHAQILLKQYQREDPIMEPEFPSRGKSSGSEGYEKTAVKHGDRAFQKFHKQLEKCPRQLIRYNRGGQPLLISDSTHCLPSKPSQTLCKHCGATCVFELQLMPTLVYCIQSQLPEQSKSSSLLGKQNMPDFGTVLVYTCSKNCWTNSSHFKEEISFLQDERQ